MNKLLREETIKYFLFPTFLSCLLFLTAIYLKPFGLIISTFSPLPIIFIYLKEGKKAGINILIAAVMLTIAFADYKYGFVYLIQYGLMAILIGETIKKRLTIEKIICMSTFIPILSGTMLLYIYLTINNIDAYSLVFDQITKSFEQTVLIYQEAGMSENSIESFKKFSESLIEPFINSTPALITSGFMLSALANYITIRFLWLKYKNTDYFNDIILKRWSVADYFIWVLILSGLAVMSDNLIIKYTGLNILIIMLLIYFFQGAAIVIFFLQKLKIPKLFKAITLFFFITQLLFLTVTLLLGVFDLWVDFRKINKKVKTV